MTKSKILLDLLKQVSEHYKHECHGVFQFNTKQEQRETFKEIKEVANYSHDTLLSYAERQQVVKYKNTVCVLNVFNQEYDLAFINGMQYSFVCVNSELDTRLKAACMSRIRQEPFLMFEYSNELISCKQPEYAYDLFCRLTYRRSHELWG